MLLETTDQFEKWLRGLKDRNAKLRILGRLSRFTESGYLGSSKALGGGLFELKFDFGPGYRIYYAFKGTTVIVLIGGGDKSSQVRDIAAARLYLA